MKKSKYHNKKVTYDGIKFASIKEARRYQELKLLLRAGAISDLQLQVPYELIPAQYINGKCVERSVKYIADFVYTENGKEVVEDVKSDATRKKESYIIKRKAMLFLKNIRVKEV